MFNEVLRLLDLKPGKVVLDATVGGSGHSAEILRRIAPDGLLIGIDVDDVALETAGKSLKDVGGSFKLIKGNFRNLDSILSREGIKAVDAAIFDIGVSSYQLDEEERGFSIKGEGRLDMRMDKSLKLTAFDVVNKYKENELSDIIYKFGEERLSRRIARFIVEERFKKPIETTRELAQIIRRAAGSRYKNSRIDPATRTFQAIRIEVNDELGALDEGLKKAVSWLAVGARIAVISFHSLEDRIVKNLFKGYKSLGILKVITKKPLRPSREEIKANPRSRSGRLRAAERI